MHIEDEQSPLVSAHALFEQRCIRVPSLRPSTTDWVHALEDRFGLYAYPTAALHEFENSENFASYKEQYQKQIGTERARSLLNTYGNSFVLGYVHDTEISPSEIEIIQEYEQLEIIEFLWKQSCEEENFKAFISQYDDEQKVLFFQEVASLTSFALFGIQKRTGRQEYDTSVIQSYFKDALLGVSTSHRKYLHTPLDAHRLVSRDKSDHVQQQLHSFVKDHWKGAQEIVSGSMELSRPLLHRYITARIDDMVDFVRDSVMRYVHDRIDAQRFEQTFDAAIDYFTYLTAAEMSRRFNFEEEAKFASNVLPHFGNSQANRLLYSIDAKFLGKDSSLLEAGLVEDVYEEMHKATNFFAGTQMYALMSAGLPDAASLAYIFGHDDRSIVPVRGNNILLKNRIDNNKIPIFVDHMISMGDTFEAAMLVYRNRGQPHKAVVTCGMFGSQEKWFTERGYKIVGNCGPMVLIEYL